MSIKEEVIFVHFLSKQYLHLQGLFLTLTEGKERNFTISQVLTAYTKKLQKN